MTGCARSEGYYKIDKKEKAKFAENLHKQVEEKDVPVVEEPVNVTLITDILDSDGGVVSKMSVSIFCAFYGVLPLLPFLSYY